MIEAKNLEFSYKGRKAVNSLSLVVSDGEMVVILGANGAGKSTFLKLLSGFLKPDSGAVYLNGENILKISSRTLALRRAFLEQECAMSFDYSVMETVELGGYATSALAGDVETSAEDSLAKAGLFGYEGRRYSELSGGEKRRVQLARALFQLGAPRGKSLLLDEPSAGLDPANAHAALAAARSAADAGASVAVVLHDANLAAAYADRIALMKNGRIVACDIPQVALTEENLTEAYGAVCEVVKNGTGFIVNFPAKKTFR